MEHVHLMTLDYKTPEKNEEEGDFSAPMQYVYGREPEDNVEASVKWWKDNQFPGKRTIIRPMIFEIHLKLHLNISRIFQPINCSLL